MNNTPEAVARILAIAQLDADKETFFEQWYFDAFKLDVIPEGYQVEITYKLTKKKTTLEDIWNKVMEPMTV